MPKQRLSNGPWRSLTKAGLLNSSQMVPLRTPVDDLRHKNSVQHLLSEMRRAEEERIAKIREAIRKLSS